MPIPCSDLLFPLQTQRQRSQGYLKQHCRRSESGSCQKLFYLARHLCQFLWLEAQQKIRASAACSLCNRLRFHLLGPLIQAVLFAQGLQHVIFQSSAVRLLRRLVSTTLSDASYSRRVSVDSLLSQHKLP